MRSDQFFTATGALYTFARGAAILAIGLALFFSFVGTVARVVGPSMAPNLLSGQLVFVDKFTRLMRPPGRGEIVQLRFPGDLEQTRYVKRVIGLPGETVVIENGQVVINNQSLTELYLSGAQTPVAPTRQWKLGPNEYLVLGDNRSVSSDSRSFGPIEKRFFLGQVRLVLWPFDQAGLVPPVYYK